MFRVLQIRTLFYTTLAVIFLLEVDCSSQGRLEKREQASEYSKQNEMPHWVLSGKHLSYSASRYLLGVGVAKSNSDDAMTRRLAENGSFSEIARQIFANVSSEITIHQIEIAGSKIHYLLEEVVADSKIRTSLTVSGLTIVDRYYDDSKETLYTLGVLDRINASEPYRRMLLQYESEFKNQMVSADQHLAIGEAFQALLSLREAFNAAFSFQEVFPFFELLAPADLRIDLNTMDIPNPSMILTKASNIFSKLQLEIVQGNNQKFIFGKPLHFPLIMKATLQDKEVIAKDVRVKFHFESGKGDVAPIGKNNVDGTISSTVYNIERSPANLHRIIAELDLADLTDTTAHSSKWNKIISSVNKRVDFQFERKKILEPARILISINQPTHYQLGKFLVEEVLSQELAEIGFSPLSEADIGNTNVKIVRDAIENAQTGSIFNRLSGKFEFALVGGMSVKPLDDFQGLKIFGVDGMIKCVSMRTGEVLGIESFQNVRGFGNTDKQAAENAIRNAVNRASDSVFASILEKF